MNTIEILKIIQNALNQIPNRRINHPQAPTTYDLANLVDEHLIMMQGGNFGTPLSEKILQTQQLNKGSTEDCKQVLTYYETLYALVQYLPTEFELFKKEIGLRKIELEQTLTSK